MKNRCYLLGVDIGTSSAKALLVDFNGNSVAQASVPYDISTPKPGYAEQDAAMLRDAAFAAIRQALSQVGSAEIAAVGFTGQMHGLVTLDRIGHPIRPIIIWADQRSAEQAALLSRSGVESVTKNPASTGFLFPSLLWVKEQEPKAFEQIHTVLFPKDYVRFCLTGVQGTDFSDASGALLYNPKTQSWDTELLKAHGIPESIFPPIHHATEVAGYVTADAAGRTGLAQGTPVVYGGGDTPTLLAGNGLVSAGNLSTNIGTASQINCICAGVPEVWQHLNAFHHVADDLWIITGASLNGGIVLKWARDTLLGGTLDFEKMDALAEASPPGANGTILLPFLCGERAPYLDPKAKAVLFGLRLATTREDIIRSVMESVVYSFRDCMELLPDMDDGISHSVIASGGGVHSPVWLQMQADILKKSILVKNRAVEAAKGAAMAAGVGVGIYASFQEASQQAVPKTAKIYEPNPRNFSVYDERFQTYRAIYKSNRHLF